MAKNYDKMDVIADYKTGQYTLRQLGTKHGISSTMVHNLTKNVSKENEDIVNKKIEIEQKLMLKTAQEVNSVQNVVNKEMEKFADFKAKLDVFSDIAMHKAVDLMNNTSYGADYKAIVEGIDKHSVTVGYNDRFNKNAGINNTNAQQNNTSETLERVIKNLPD